MITYIEKEGKLVEKKTGKILTTLPQFQRAESKLRMLGELPVGATFTHDGKLYRKITHQTDGYIPVLHVTGKVGRPAKPSLPYWLIVTV